MTLLHLAQRCENAAGPDRELDALIYRGLAGFTEDHWFTYGDTHYTDERVPFVTASLDAAMTLVPKGWSVALHAHSDDESRASVYSDNSAAHDFRYAATPALSLCAAALSAQFALVREPK